MVNKITEYDFVNYNGVYPYKDIFENTILTMEEKLVIIFMLVNHNNSKKLRDSLAEITSASDKKSQRILSSLKEKGMLKVKQFIDANGRFSNTGYMLTDAIYTKNGVDNINKCLSDSTSDTIENVDSEQITPSDKSVHRIPLYEFPVFERVMQDFPIKNFLQSTSIKDFLDSGICSRINNVDFSQINAHDTIEIPLDKSVQRFFICEINDFCIKNSLKQGFWLNIKDIPTDVNVENLENYEPSSYILDNQENVCFWIKNKDCQLKNGCTGNLTTCLNSCKSRGEEMQHIIYNINIIKNIIKINYIFKLYMLKNSTTKTVEKELNIDLPEYKLSKFLFDKIKLHKSSAKTPNYSTWMTDMRLLLEKDERDYDLVLDVIEFCQQDKFWKNNILSPRKLRIQFSLLEQALTRAKGRTNNNIRDVCEKDEILELSENLQKYFSSTVLGKESTNFSRQDKGKFYETAHRIFNLHKHSGNKKSRLFDLLIKSISDRFPNQAICIGHLCSEAIWDIYFPQYLKKMGIELKYKYTQ